MNKNEWFEKNVEIIILSSYGQRIIGTVLDVDEDFVILKNGDLVLRVDKKNIIAIERNIRKNPFKKNKK